jgi:hypothetical protein
MLVCGSLKAANLGMDMYGERELGIEIPEEGHPHN